MACLLTELLDILIAQEQLGHARALALHLEKETALRELKQAKALAAEEDRFEDAAAMRDQITSITNDLAAGEKTVSSWRAAAAASVPAMPGSLMLERMRDDIREHVGESAATAFEQTSFQPLSLVEQAQRGDLEGAFTRLATAKRRATLLIALHSTHADQTEIWKQVLAVVRHHADLLLSTLTDVAALKEEEARKVCGEDRFSSFVRGAAAVLRVGLLVCASADELSMFQGQDGVSAKLGLRAEEIRSFASSAVEVLLGLSEGDMGGLASCLADVVEGSPAAKLAESREPSENCALSWYPISPKNPVVSHGQASCLAACGNLFVNLVLGRGDTGAPLKPQPPRRYC
jgi:hypothetical protein